MSEFSPPISGIGGGFTLYRVPELRWQRYLAADCESPTLRCRWVGPDYLPCQLQLPGGGLALKHPGARFRLQ